MATQQPLVFGKALKEQFHFDPEWRNLNHGSFGATPRAIKEKQIDHQLQSEAAPDRYLRYDYPKVLDASRAALAKHVNAPVDSIVLVTNATTAVNVVFQNMQWSSDGTDEILSFSTIYGACGKIIDYVTDTNRLVSSRVIDLKYPLEDEEIINLFREAVASSRAQGKNPRIVVFDIVSSMPGVRFPYEDMTKTCRELGVLSLIDGAQGVGMVPLDLAALDADFVLSNCHKWLFTPRGCAFLYVPQRHQPWITTTLPTSHGYVPKKNTGRNNPLPREKDKTAFVENFQFVGSIDNSAYASVADSLQWRAEALGGELRIMEYLWQLAKEGGSRAAEILGTRVLENAKGTLTNCAMVNVWLPVRSADVNQVMSGPDGIVLPKDESLEAIQWASKVLVDEYKTFIALGIHGDRWLMRLSAQVYLEAEDFEWAAYKMKEVVERVAKREYSQQ
ncbi:hypothetical protein HIM_05472 [Hirsutella minnesotensis 3608]|uniref:Aminotransferase class V domain-containing protein n=1 Tax=Hirsutella minnesotensis 3608 TaxID=1043627 RepID=A0A0F7ZK54_9HYPO|nr:hypothetical protein HIM_05472 [Hirsutella minnesotensis 3608]